MPGAEHAEVRGGHPAESTALLAHALRYALRAARAATPALLGRPTPCHGWDLGMLLRHMNDSVEALWEAMTADGVDMWPSPEPADACRDPAAAFRAGASQLLTLAGGDGRTGTVTVAGMPLPAAVVARTGALEVAVHGWDVARAVGLHGPIPAAPAAALLRTAHEVVPPPAWRHPLFAPPVPVSRDADPSDRLLAFLGRDPGPP